MRAVQCSRNVGNQSSRDDASHPRRQMKRCGSRKLASRCASQKGEPEEELILFQFVLFTV